MSGKRVNFELPEGLITRADIAADVARKSRTEVLIEALREYLERKKSEESFRESAVELYLNGELEVENLAEIIGRQDAEAVRSSKNNLDRGDETSDELADLNHSFGGWFVVCLYFYSSIHGTSVR